MTDDELDCIEERASEGGFPLVAARYDLKALVSEVRRLKALVPGERGRCSICGEPYHRYAANDPEHDWSPVACINSLRGHIEELEANAP